MPPWENSLNRFKHWLIHGHVFRYLAIKKYFSSKNVRKLQIAPGELPVNKKGWLTADIYTGNIYLDATKKLPFKNNSIDYIFSEHFLEHLNFSTALMHLNEIYRVLKPSGIVRISLPDLHRVCEIYLEDNRDFLRSFLELQRRTVPDDQKPIFNSREHVFPAEYINASFYIYDHKFMWDYEFLEQTFKALGFVEIEKNKIGESNDTELKNLERHSEFDRLNDLVAISIEATKPVKKIDANYELSGLIKYFLSRKPSKGRL